jgi:hypothetical protein
MKRLLIIAGIATLLAAAWPGHAQQQPPGGGRRGMEPPMRPMPPPQRDQMPMRDFRGDRDAQDPRRGGQLSPEERRQLRRDIGDHGRDVYPDRHPPQR